MAVAQSRADVVWEGDLVRGQGWVDYESGVIKKQPITWATRTRRTPGTTSPEEMIAAAHAGCYAMAFSHTLAQAGALPTRLEVAATCSFDQVEGKYKITTMDLDVVGVVPELDEARFEELARQAEQACPVSNALRNNVDIRLKARLER
ncbi:MAG: OsmC family peroxiredoxin [Sphingomonadaceae bacterium]